MSRGSAYWGVKLPLARKSSIFPYLFIVPRPQAGAFLACLVLSARAIPGAKSNREREGEREGDICKFKRLK